MDDQVKDNNSTAGLSNISNGGVDTVFTDDSPEMRDHLRSTISNAAKLGNFTNDQLKEQLSFIAEIMNCLGYPSEKKDQIMNEMCFGINMIAIDRLFDSFSDEARAMFTPVFENTDDPSRIPPELIRDLQDYIAQTFTKRQMFEFNTVAVAAVVDLYLKEFLKEANEDQRKEIDKILFQLSEKLSEFQPDEDLLKDIEAS